MSLEDTIVLNILLNCEQTKSSETKQVHFQSLPTTPLEIKKKIEEDFSIPSCVQTLHYQSMILTDSDELQHTHVHFRSGDTFTVDYPIEGECEMVRNVIKWMREILELLQSIDEINPLPDGEKKDHLMFSNVQKVEHMTAVGKADGTLDALYMDMFYPWKNMKKYVNKLHFRQEGGLDVLMKVYDLLVSKEWGDIGIDDHLLNLEDHCAGALTNYAATFTLSRQIIKLGGLEMCLKSLLKKKLGRNGSDEVNPNSTMACILESAIGALCNLSELPENHVSLARRSDVIDQILAIALHPAYYGCDIAVQSAGLIVNLAQSPNAHPYLVRTEVVEDMLKMLKQYQAMKKDPAAIKILQSYICIALAQIGLGSPDLYGAIPPHLQEHILNLMSDFLETGIPAEIRHYEEQEMESAWDTFLPYIRFLYTPSASKMLSAAETNLHFHCCINVLLHGLENALGRDLHLEILIKEGLLDYTMCLPAVLPGECQPRARSLVNELGRHRQLQPPSLCTLAKAHIAKTFCGLQAVMEMSSIGEFVHEFYKSC